MSPRWVGQARLGLAEASRSESLAPRPAALPHAAAIGAAVAVLRCRRLVVAFAPPLQLCTAVLPAGGPAATTRA